MQPAAPRAWERLGEREQCPAQRSQRGTSPPWWHPLEGLGYVSSSLLHPPWDPLPLRLQTAAGEGTEPPRSTCFRGSAVPCSLGQASLELQPPSKAVAWKRPLALPLDICVAELSIHISIPLSLLQQCICLDSTGSSSLQMDTPLTMG